MDDSCRSDQPGEDQKQSGDFGGRTLFVQKEDSCQKAQRQTQLTESLDETDIADMLHGKKYQRIGSGAANTCYDGVDDLSAP